MLSPKAHVAELRKFLPGIVVREILAAREGLKVARTGLTAPTAQRLRQFGVGNGFSVVIGSTEVFPRRDRCKGGWCNGSHDSGIPGRGFLNVYVAANESLARRALDAEISGDDLAFGAALGTPVCCQAFYDSVKDQAALEQNDFFPFSAPRAATTPANALLNLGAQYFDAALISHFPCSFDCERSIALARANARLMFTYDRDWLEETIGLLNHGAVYTEYMGIYLLPNAEVGREARIRYTPRKIKGTSNGRILQALAKGDSVSMFGETLEISRNSLVVASFCPRNLRLYASRPVTMAEAVA